MYVEATQCYTHPLSDAQKKLTAAENAAGSLPTVSTACAHPAGMKMASGARTSNEHGLVGAGGEGAVDVDSASRGRVL